jgi:C-terminal topoisomerase domain
VQCNPLDVPVEKSFNKSMQAKFHWAIDVEREFRFCFISTLEGFGRGSTSRVATTYRAGWNFPSVPNVGKGYVEVNAY